MPKLTRGAAERTAAERGDAGVDAGVDAGLDAGVEAGAHRSALATR